VLAVCVHPGQPTPLALWEDVAHLIRVLARGHPDVPGRAVPGVLVAQTGAQVLRAGDPGAELGDPGVLIVDFHLRPGQNGEEPEKRLHLLIL
jgi:hypothetical protein